jgi:hypothetical protein
LGETGDNQSHDAPRPCRRSGDICRSSALSQFQRWHPDLHSGVRCRTVSPLLRRFPSPWTVEAICGCRSGVSLLRLLTAQAALLISWTPALATEAGEHWVCSIPHKLESAHTVIFDLQVEGNELIEKSPSDRRWQIVRNDEKVLVAIWAATSIPPSVPGIANVLGITKESSSFKITQVWLSGDDIISEGDCRKLDQ